MAKGIFYPLERDHPIPSIKNKDDFINRFDVIFDEYLINKIINSDIDKDWDTAGWRGMMLDRGTLWLNYDGTIRSINYQSQLEANLKKNIIKRQKSILHWSVRDYESSVISGLTTKHKIRIDSIKNGGYRYSAWTINKSINEKPDLILFSNDMEVVGSMRNVHYRFYNNGYKYEVTDYYGGREKELLVYKGDKLLLQDEIK